MKNLRSLFPAICFAAIITLLASSCSKDRSVVAEKNASTSNLVKDTDVSGPSDQKYGAVKGFVTPVITNATLSLYNSDFTFHTSADPTTGFFGINNVPPGIYTLDVVSSVWQYGDIEMDVIVKADNSTILNITLPRR